MEYCCVALQVTSFSWATCVASSLSRHISIFIFTRTFKL